MIGIDSSYVARCYVEDRGFAEVRELVQSEEVACAELGQAEVVSVFHRKLREGALTPDQFAAVANQFEADLSAGLFTWLPVTSWILADVRHSFTKLPATVFLRSADAIHLACAREAGIREIYTNDKHMLAAAPHFGLLGRNILPS